MGDTTPTRSYYGPTRADENWMAEHSNAMPAQDDPRSAMATIDNHSKVNQLSGLDRSLSTMMLDLPKL